MQSKPPFRKMFVTLAVIVVNICAVIACTPVIGRPPSLLPSATFRPTPLAPVRSTPTALPPVNPTPIGGPISVTTPLPMPALSPLAITPLNVERITETLRLSEPEPSNLGVSSLAFTRDGQWLVSAWDRLSIWQMPTGERIRSLPIHSSRWTPIALSPDGQWVAVGNYPQLGWVELWNLETGQRVRQHQGGDQVIAVGFSAAGTLLAAGRTDGSVTVWQVTTGDLLARLPNAGGSGCRGMAFHPERDEIAAAGRNNTIRLWDAASGQVKRELVMPNPPASCELSYLAFRPDGKMLAAAMFGKQRIAVWEGDTFAGDLTHPNSGTIWKIAWSPNGQLLAASENGGPKGRQIVLWDVQNRRVVRVLSEWGGEAMFSPDGALLVAEGIDSTNNKLTVTLRVLAIRP
jgi:WD40 repeat protein